MKYEVLVVDEAETDLLEIYRYVAFNDSLEKADHLLDKLEGVIRGLDRFPMSPSADHEMWNRQIERLIGIALLETGTNARFLGSTTFKHSEESCGFEPDSCYYIQRFSQVKGLRKIDLSQHPAPDLVVEISASQPLSDRTGLFARLGIPEVWYLSDNQLKILHLSQGAYQERESSLALPVLTAPVLNEFLAKLFETEDISLFRDFQSWVRSQAAR